MADYSVDVSRVLERFKNLDVGRIAAAAVNEATEYAQQFIMADTPIKDGNARNGWHISHKATSAVPVAHLSNNQAHILALEYGSEPGKDPWPKPGPKTEIAHNEQNSGTIVSTQAPAGMIRKNLEGIKQVLMDGITRRMGDV